MQWQRRGKAENLAELQKDWAENSLKVPNGEYFLKIEWHHKNEFNFISAALGAITFMN